MGKMIDINMSQFGVNALLALLNAAHETSLQYPEDLYLSGMNKGMEVVLMYLDIKPVFDGDSYVGLIAKVGEGE